MTKILFDLDGTITKQETLPIIAHAFSMQNNILSLTQDTVEEVVTYYKNKNHRVIYIGDGNNDVEAMRLADVSIASWLTHQPSLGVIMTSDYLVTSEVSLCRLLNQLL
ncbi:HAD hydrolase family protein [Desulfovibrio piger]|uniref:HAD hydrolase family protein n=1 Tax=Desulfovibrio piger TaxID=901 RepID=UPI0032BF8018